MGRLNVNAVSQGLSAAGGFMRSETFHTTVRSALNYNTTGSFHTALSSVAQYAKAHPGQVTGIAIQTSAIVILGPAGVTALPLKIVGFTGAGPALGSLAAWWQATSYGAYIPAGSIFSVCQAVGMKTTWLQALAVPMGTVVAALGTVLSRDNGTAREG